jgi:hypothetical protein
VREKDLGVELDALLDLEGWGRTSVELRLRRILRMARAHAVELAGTRLEGPRQQWVDALGEPTFEALSPTIMRASLVLGEGGAAGNVKAFAHMLEEGAPAWDLRLTMFPGRPEKQHQIKRDAEGFRYRSIPFKHSMGGAKPAGHQFTRTGQRPNSLAHRGALDLAGAQVVNRAVSDGMARIKGRDARRAAGQLPPHTRGNTRTAPGLPTKWGERLDAGLAPILRQRHVTDIFSGMVRTSKDYEKKQDEGGHMTFRTISENPGTHRYDTDGRGGPGGKRNVMGNTSERNWTHPGFPGVFILRDTQSYALSIAGEHFGPLDSGAPGA